MSAKSCCIPQCGKTRSDNVVLHGFPNPEKDKESFLSWVTAVGSSLASLDSQFIYRNRKICHDHFENRYLTWTRNLTNIAVPTLRMPAVSQQRTEDVNPMDPKLVQKSQESFGEDVPYESTENVTSTSPKLIKQTQKSVRKEKTAEDPEERGWGPRCRQEAPKASDRTLTGDKEADDANDDVALLRMCVTLHPATSDKEESRWAEEQMDGIETIEVADDVTAPPEFSWQRPPEVIPCADDVDIQADVSPTAPVSAGRDGGDDRRPIGSYNDRLHVGYKCNECGSEIVGYRYTCVQCCGVELCGACEASGAHPEHYVLRLPRPEPAGRLGGVLETLRGLLDHLPLQALHEVKKEEIDDADPLSSGFVPPEPLNEDDDYEFEEYEENEEPTKEARLPLHDKLSPTDLRPLNVDITSNTCTDTANIQHPAHENSPDKVCLDVGSRSSKKVLLRLKKLSEVNDDSAVKCSVVRPCEGEMEMSGARAASGVSVTKLGTGVAKSRPGVTTVRTGVTTSGAGVTTSGASVTKLGTGVAKSRPVVTTVRTGVTTSGAGVTTSGAGVTTWGTSVTKLGAGVAKSRPVMTTVRTGVTTPGASVNTSGACVRAGSIVSSKLVEMPVVKLERLNDRLLRGEGAWTLIP